MSISIWFDFHVATAATDSTSASTTPHKLGLQIVGTPIGSLIMRNAYWGDFDKSSGLPLPMGFWDWIPRCVSLTKEVCAYPLPDKWKKPLRGGWHWGEVEKHWKRQFLALTEDKPLGKKIGVIADFKVNDFKGYKAGAPIKKENYTGRGLWVINDGQLKLEGNWQFVNLVYE